MRDKCLREQNISHLAKTLKKEIYYVLNEKHENKSETAEEFKQLALLQP